MKRIYFTLIVFVLFLSTSTINAQSEPLELTGTQTRSIIGISTSLNGFTLEGNSTLHIKDSSIEMMDTTYQGKDSSTLIIENSTIKWLGKGGIRLHDNTKTRVVKSTIYMRYEVANRTYYGHGFGLSESSEISIENSDTGYIKITDQAKCTVNGGKVGEFGSTSSGECELEGVEVGSIILTYEDTWLQLNSTRLGEPYWTTADIVKNGNSTFPVTLREVMLLNPPSFQLANCNFEANNTEVDLILIGGNSGLTILDVNMTLLYLVEDVWANVIDSKLSVLRCRNGDFNIKVTDSMMETLETMMTTGFNLQLTESNVGNLDLMYAHPEAPNNVEIVNTTISSLYLTPSSPPVYMFDGSTVQDQIILESGDGSSNPPLLTGSLCFGDACEIQQDEREGITELTRVYMVLLENSTSTEKKYALMNGNTTLKTGTIGESNTLVFPVKYRSEYSLIENPLPGGPYMIDTNNFTQPLTLKIEETETNITLTTKTPIKITIKKETQSPPISEPTPSSYNGLVAITTLAVLGALFFILRKGRGNISNNDPINYINLNNPHNRVEQTYFTRREQRGGRGGTMYQ